MTDARLIHEFSAPIEIMNFIITAKIKLTDIFLTSFYRINEMTQSSCLYSPKVDGLEPN